MRSLLLLVSFSAILSMLPSIGAAQNEYALTPESQQQADVPRGEVKGPFEFRSEIFPGTVRNYWVYVPAQYEKESSACLLIVQDGINRAKEWRLPTVMDNLIHKNEMPVTMGLFIEPGVVTALSEDALPRFNRSYEYDSMTDRYARFLVEEMLPELGKMYALSDDPNDRAIAGASSGAICALSAAWNRPDQFRRVLSTIGTYVGLRGGDQFSSLVRKHEPQPIRIFLQDGSNDLNLYGGDWWMANQTMNRALKWAGYDVRHAWGDGGHDGKQGAAVMPEALRWLWRDYPDPIQPSTTGQPRRTDVLTPGEGWELVSEGHGFTEGPAVNEDGELFFSDLRNNKIHRVDLDGNVSVFADDTNAANGLMFGVDGRLYACANGAKQIVAYAPDGEREVLYGGAGSNDLAVNPHGIYFTEPGEQRVHLLRPNGKAEVVAEGLGFCNGVVISPDQAFLYTCDMRGKTVYSFQIQPDGSLAHREPLFDLHLPPEGTETSADGMTVDTMGRLYVATNLGVQICDPLGRVQLILAKPDRQWLANVVMAGPELNILYATAGTKVYRRKLNAKGVQPWAEPVTPPKPHL